MLILTMNIGMERYGVNSLYVTEVIPMIKLDHIPMVDKVIKGIFNYRGIPTPVIDLCQFFEEHDCKENLGTRIVIINFSQNGHPDRPIGLIAERITEVIKCDEQLLSSGIKSGSTPFLGDIYKYNDEMIHIIDVRNILPASIAQQIFADKTSNG